MCGQTAGKEGGRWREGRAASPPVERRGLPALLSSLMPGIVLHCARVSLRVTAEAGLGLLGRHRGLVFCLPCSPPCSPLG